MSQGRHPGSLYSWRMGQKAGQETHTMNLQELPSHAHSASLSSNDPVVISTSISATTEDGDSASPSTGAYLATALPPGGGPDKPEQIYKTGPATSSLVNLGGVSASVNANATVTVNPNGASKAFSIMQPTLALNYCLAMVGTYPPRS